MLIALRWTAVILCVIAWLVIAPMIVGGPDGP